jgi:hypothetical protein
MSDSLFKNALNEKINNCQSLGYADEIIARQVYCFDKSPILELDIYKNIGFEILSKISDHFSIPFRCIYIAGSVQTGYSYFKNRDFIPKKSDLDLAIVNSNIYKRYLDEAFNITKRYTDNRKFKNENDMKSFRNYITKGMYKPELMPQSDIQIEWEKYFNNLSSDYIDYFKNINCCIYLSENTFEWKQVSTIERYRSTNDA